MRGKSRNEMRKYALIPIALAIAITTHGVATAYLYVFLKNGQMVEVAA